MLQKTHSIAGLVAAELVIAYQGVPFFSWEAAGAALLGCLVGPLADVDKPSSTMAKVLFPVSALLYVVNVRHRTMTHSILFVAALSMLASQLPSLYFWTFLIAYASHPFIDMFNEQGVQLFWPVRGHIRLVPHWMAVRTGSAVEVALRWILLGLSIGIPIAATVYALRMPMPYAP